MTWYCRHGIRSHAMSICHFSSMAKNQLHARCPILVFKKLLPTNVLPLTVSIFQNVLPLTLLISPNVLPPTVSDSQNVLPLTVSVSPNVLPPNELPPTVSVSQNVQSCKECVGNVNKGKENAGSQFKKLCWPGSGNNEAVLRLLSCVNKLQPGRFFGQCASFVFPDCL